MRVPERDPLFALDVATAFGESQKTTVGVGPPRFVIVAMRNRSPLRNLSVLHFHESSVVSSSSSVPGCWWPAPRTSFSDFDTIVTFSTPLIGIAEFK